jgi:hypothetical protein
MDEATEDTTKDALDATTNDATTEDDLKESGVVLPRNAGWIDTGGVHRWLPAGTRLDPVEDAEMIAFLTRMGVLETE